MLQTMQLFAQISPNDTVGFGSADEIWTRFAWNWSER